MSRQILTTGSGPLKTDTVPLRSSSFPSTSRTICGSSLPQLLDATGNPDQKQIAETAEYYVKRAYDTLLDSMKSEEIDRILELKKDFPSKREYGRFDIYDVFHAHFETMKEEMVKNVSDRVTKEIEKLPIQERLARFSRPEDSPPLEIQRTDGNTWGAGAPPKGDGFAKRFG